jgi:hypothetical protein
VDALRLWTKDAVVLGVKLRIVRLCDDDVET